MNNNKIKNHSNDSLFFTRSNLDNTKVDNIVSDALHKADDGELFMEFCESESFVFDDQRLKSASFDTSKGFGLRAIAGESSGYAHSSDIDEKALKKASDTVNFITKDNNANFNASFSKTNRKLYHEVNPINETDFSAKVDVLKKIDEYARSKNPNVKQVSASLNGEWQAVRIYRPGGIMIEDLRPLVRLYISIVLEKDGRQENGSRGSGGRVDYAKFLEASHWQNQVDEAINQAEINLTSIDTPAGEMDVVLGPGYPGVLLHEAIGHGLEGDFNRKKTSAFHNLMGQKVASEGVTIVDDGTIDNRRGSLTIDDEGTPTERTVLIENGILKNFMQDRLNARLMNTRSTGSGRRENYRHVVLPRMRNTMMLSGNQTQDEMIKSVDKGIFAVSFGGGQVDITSGKFVFNCTEAYEIINGKIGSPIKGATLIGDGPSILKEVSMVGNDMMLDPGIGTCGKAGQGVPVGVAQPSILIDKMTVGGTKL